MFIYFNPPPPTDTPSTSGPTQTANVLLVFVDTHRQPPAGRVMFGPGYPLWWSRGGRGTSSVTF